MLVLGWSALLWVPQWLRLDWMPPAVGGILDSDACGAANQGAAAKLVRLGDVCVSPFATDWDCQRCFWAAEPYAKPAPGALAEAPETARSRNACAKAPRGPGGKQECSIRLQYACFARL